MSPTLERLLTIFNAVLKAELSGSEEDVRSALAVLDESEASRLRNAMYNIHELAEEQRKWLRRVRGAVMSVCPCSCSPGTVCGCTGCDCKHHTGPPVRVVPKVTADPRTHALWALAQNDRARARELTGAMGTSERRAYLALLTELINMLWSDA